MLYYDFVVWYCRKEQPDLELQSPVKCWFQMLEHCQRAGKDHTVMATIYLTHLVPHLQMISDDVVRIHKRVSVLH